MMTMSPGFRSGAEPFDVNREALTVDRAIETQALDPVAAQRARNVVVFQ